MSKKMQPLWAVMLTDELALHRLASGEALQRAVREGRSLVGVGKLNLPSPMVVPHVREDAFSLHIDGSDKPDQLSLGVVAQTLRSAGLSISNSYSQISFARAIAQMKRHGAKALVPGRHWYLCRYRSPIVIMRTDQAYQNGFDALLRSLSETGSALTMSELSRLSEQAIGSSLPPEESHRYHMERR